MESKTILLIDDEKPVRDTLKYFLEVEGYRVITAINGKEGIEKLKEIPRSSAILLDMMMPVMNGWDFMDHVKSDGATADIPVIIVSAYHEIARSMHLHAIVPKPVRLDHLLTVLHSCAA